MKLSYNEACTRDCSSLEKDLILCEKAGFDYIEIRLDMLEKYMETHTIKDLASFFKTSRIRPHAFNALYLYPEFLGENDDKQKRQKLLAKFELGCKTAQAIGSHYFIVVPPLQCDPTGGPFTGTWEETYRNCVRILKKLSVMAKPYEMKLCFELVGFERSSVRSVAEADSIVRAVDEPNVGFVFDAYNLFLNSGSNDFSAVEAVQTEKIFAAHIMSADDVPVDLRGQDKRCFCGQGVVDTDAFLRTLKKCGYNGMISVETFRPEYWQKTPEWVIETAFVTTHFALEKNECL